MKQISDKDIINYLLSMYPNDEEKIEIKIENNEIVDVEKDLSNIMKEHYNKKEKSNMFYILMFVIILLVVYILFRVIKRREY